MITRITNDNRNVRQWFVMHISKKEEEAERLLAEFGGLECFVPKRCDVRTRCNGKKVKVYVPVLPSYVFVRASYQEIVNFKKVKMNDLGFVTWRSVAEGVRYLVVEDDQMENFMRVSRDYESNPVYMKPDEIDIKKGTRVKIHGGSLDGVVGAFMKVKGFRSRRLVILLDGVQAITAEVAPDVVEILSEKDV